MSNTVINARASSHQSEEFLPGVTTEVLDRVHPVLSLRGFGGTIAKKQGGWPLHEALASVLTSTPGNAFLGGG